MRSTLSRRAFLKTAGVATTTVCAGPALSAGSALSSGKSVVYRINNCPVHDNQFRHVGMDSLLGLLAAQGIKLYRTQKTHTWGGPSGIIDKADVVLIKVNAQWKCRGATNTDVLRGLIHRILEHPDGFAGEVVIFENGQGQGSFDGKPRAWNSYANYPEIVNAVSVNAEDVTLTIDRLVKTEFAGKPVSSYLLDPLRQRFITDSDHTTDGFRKIAAHNVSYPCFRTAGGRRVELREGVWNGSGFSSNLKLINLPVLKTHEGSGITGALKHCYGVFSTADGVATQVRHYNECGSQCGKMWSIVRRADLHIVDCIWVNHQTLHNGYPPENTFRSNILLAGLDPVALDYYASKHILLPLGGNRVQEHNPDTFAGLIAQLRGARDTINQNGGIQGAQAQMGDENIAVIAQGASSTSIGQMANRQSRRGPTTLVVKVNGTIEFGLSVPAKVRLEIHDSMGRKIRSLYNGRCSEGLHSVSLKGLDVGAGAWWAVLYCDDRRGESVRI